ncbi:MAG: thiamine-binding protein [Archaeoglobus sp.]|jgi:uncharacterized protein (TIGR00106 family)|nr:MAG: thiamine-binding protein [Archaeoglobus sp.]
MIVELSVVPIGVGESLSKYISDVLRLLEERGVKYQLNPMGTVVELEAFSELGELLEDIRKHLEMKGAPRIYFVVKIDWRKKGTSMEYKIESVKKKLGKS